MQKLKANHEDVGTKFSLSKKESRNIRIISGRIWRFSERLCHTVATVDFVAELDIRYGKRSMKESSQLEKVVSLVFRIVDDVGWININWCRYLDLTSVRQSGRGISKNESLLYSIRRWST